MSIDCLKSVCRCRWPRSSTRMLGSAPAARYSSASRKAEIDPPKPDPTMQTSTRPHGRFPCAVRSADSTRR